jgi:hypothetical protein
MKNQVYYVIIMTIVLTIPLAGCRNDAVTSTPGNAHPAKSSIWPIYEAVKRGNSVTGNHLIEELGEPFSKEKELNGERWSFASPEGKEILIVIVNSTGVIIRASIVDTY